MATTYVPSTVGSINRSAQGAYQFQYNQLDTDGNHIRRLGNVEKWEELKAFFYSAHTRQLLGSTNEDWIKRVIFYSAFYTGLLAFFIVLLGFALLPIDDIVPFQQRMASPLKMQPGLGFRPVPDFESNLIRFQQGNPATYKPYTDHLQALLDQYENERQVGEHFIGCKDGRPPDTRDKVCRFEVNWLGDECTWQKDYGYDEGKPCIIFKLNKIFDWEAETYLNISEAPEIMQDRYHEDFIGFSCEGAYSADIENIGTITYWHPGGFPRWYYPFLNQEGFRSPLVMVKFNNPTNGVVVNVECKVWARNIYQDRNDKAGLITFELLVD